MPKNVEKDLMENMGRRRKSVAETLTGTKVEEKKVPTTVYLPESHHAALRVHCAITGKKMTEIIRTQVETYLRSQDLID